MKNRNEQLQKIKQFCKLSGIYYGRMKRGMTVSQLVSQLDSEQFIYEYYKDSNDIELLSYTGFIEKDEDIEENWYALAKAAKDFYNTNKTGNKIIDEYILKMSIRENI